MRNKLMSYLFAGIVAFAGLSSVAAHTEAEANRVAVAGVWDYSRVKDGNNNDEKSNFSRAGGYLSYTYGKVWEPYFQLRGSWLGRSNNIKAPVDLFTGVAGDHHVYAHTAAVQGRLGYVFPLGNFEGMSVAPYVGYGYFNEKAHISRNNAQATQRTRSGCIPVGLVFGWDVNKQWNLAIDAQVLWNTNGTVKLTNAATDASVRAAIVAANVASASADTISNAALAAGAQANVVATLLANGSAGVGAPLAADTTLTNAVVAAGNAGAAGATYADVSVGNIDEKLRPRVRFGAEFPITYSFASNWDLSLVPSYFYTRVASKRDATFGHRADTKANEFGARLELGYAF